MNTYAALAIMAVPLGYAAWLTLRDLEEALRRALVGLLLFTLVFLVWFRIRSYGYYFHFKLLAFVGPILLTIAVAGAAKVRVRRAGVIGVVVLGMLATSAAAHEIGSTFDGLPKSVLELQRVDRLLPPGKSVRLHIDPQEQNWGAFMVYGQRVCSQKPLLGTNYPHVQVSRKRRLHDHEGRRRAAGGRCGRTGAADAGLHAVAGAGAGAGAAGDPGARPLLTGDGRDGDERGHRRRVNGGPRAENR